MLGSCEVNKTSFSEPIVQELVKFHHVKMLQTGPKDEVFALDLNALQQPDITGFAAWSGSELLGVGAFKTHYGFGEIKAMRTVPNKLRLGVGSSILMNIESFAISEGVELIKLETGSSSYFVAANAFYKKHNYTLCRPFANYEHNGVSLFYEKSLRREA